jgi:16S rRNA (uracil1498-N3)-methyltransferase
MIPRFFCPFPLHPGATVELAAEAAHHALKVLRVGAGDTAILFDGRGGQWRATLNPAGKSPARHLDRVRMTPNREPPLGADAGTGTARQRQDGFRGAERPSNSASRTFSRSRRSAAWSGFPPSAPSAARSTGATSPSPPASNPVATGSRPSRPILDLPQYLGIAARENTLRFVCAPGVSGSLRKLAVPTAPVVLLVGPEGGFEAGELLAAHAAGFQPIQLGPRVLRTETAGLGAVAAMMALWGDW